MSNFFQSARLADKLILFFASFFILFLSTFATCKKDIDALPAFPAAPQTGANTMGAIVNGNQFIVYQLPGSLDRSLIAQYDNQSFLLFGNDPSNGFQGNISINIYNMYGIGKYTLANELENNTLTNNWANLVFVTPSGQGCNCQTDSVHTGTVNITRFDIVNHIIFGTFSMTPSSASGQTAIVQSGRFDVTYIPPH
jgi:hypothetical protein